MATKIRIRRDTAANWASVNPVLADGEMGVEKDTRKFKFGDGVTAWNSLAYASGETTGGGGTTWYTGSGAPASGIGVVNDFYLDSSNGDFYKKTGSTTWTLQGNLRGPQGVQGPQGPAGQGVPAGGAAGYALVKNSANDYDTSWAPVSGGNPYTDEMAQDAVGSILADTNTVDFTYDDTNNQIRADVKQQMSVTSDTNGLKLSGDTASPGNNKFYGTNPTGTKGWYTLPDRVLMIQVVDENTTLTTGDGKRIFPIPAELNGYKLISAHAAVTTVSTSGAPTIQLRKVAGAIDILSTRITIDVNENTSYTAATPPVVNASNNTVSTGDMIAVDVDASGTGTKGLSLILTFRLS